MFCIFDLGLLLGCFVCLFGYGCSIVELLWCLFELDGLLIVVVCYSLLICCV